MGAYLKAGTAAAGKYTLSWSATARTTTGANKNYKFEPCQNVTNIDKAAAGSIISANGPNCFAAGAFVTVAAGDIITMLCQNQTDITDITIVDMNLRMLRYASP